LPNPPHLLIYFTSSLPHFFLLRLLPSKLLGHQFRREVDVLSCGVGDWGRGRKKNQILKTRRGLREMERRRMAWLLVLLVG
jgi:hypothetical protein